MNVLDRIVKPNDPSAEIRVRLEHDLANLDKLSQDELEDQNVFDQEGTASSKKRLEAARKRTQSAREDVGRTKRLLDTAIKREGAKYRADLERELAELNAKNEKLIKSDDRLAKRYAETAILLASLKAERRDLNRQQAENNSRADAIAEELGRDVPVRPIQDWEPTLVTVRPHVEKLLSKLDENDPRRVYVREIVPAPKGIFQSHDFTPAKAVI